MNLERLKSYYHRPRELRAVELLQSAETYPGLVTWREHETKVRFVSLPAFYPYSVWALQIRENTAYVRRIEWDHGADAQIADAVPAAAPTTFGADAQVPIDAANELLKELAGISLPPFLPVRTLGLDGITFGIVFGNSWRSASLSWWGEPPKEWQPLAACYDRAISLFERFLPLSTARNPRLQTEA